MRKLVMVALALVVPVLWLPAQDAAKTAAAKQAPAAAGGVTKAVCVLHHTKDNKAHGVIHFTVMGDEVEVKGEIMGLTPGEHAFHVHEFGDCSSPDAMSAGGHFNPDKQPHGGPHSAKRHVGDLGNIKADASGKAVIDIRDKLIKLHGPHSIIGRSLIVHAKADDLKSQPAGDAGARVACGVIGVAK